LLDIIKQQDTAAVRDVYWL